MSQHFFSSPKKRKELLDSRKRLINKAMGFIFLSFLSLLVTHELVYQNSNKVTVSENWNMLLPQLDKNSLQAQEGRKTASQNTQEVMGLTWEQKILEKLNTKLSRQTASLGREPDAVNVFSVSELAGRYRIVTQPNSTGRVIIKELEYIKALDQLSQPYSPGNVRDFLNKNRELFGISENPLQVSAPDSKKQLSFEAFERDTDYLVKINVLLTEQGQLLKLNVESSE